MKPINCRVVFLCFPLDVTNGYSDHWGEKEIVKKGNKNRGKTKSNKNMDELEQSNIDYYPTNIL